MFAASSVRTAIAIAVQLPRDSEREVEASLSELKQLLAGLEIEVVGTLVQKRPNATSASLLGEGKLAELAQLVAAVSGGLVVADAELSPAQQRSLELATGAEVLDRTAVILRIFERRARTRAARLEVELARLTYALPRIREDRSLGDREGGGGRAGRGHSNVELKKQAHREQIAALRAELVALEASAAARRQQRRASNRVAIVGYTNAGKSSLMHLLTGSQVLVRDSLFATLDTTVRKLVPPTQPPIVIADTVGFVRRLPHALVASFRSTLDEVCDASLLLCVVDATDPELSEQLEVTRRVLAEVGAGETPAWLLCNKIDRLDPSQREHLAERYPEALQLSAHSAADGSELRDRISAFFAVSHVTELFEIPYERQGVLAELRDEIQLESTEYADTMRVVIRAPPETLARLKSRLARGDAKRR